MVPCPLFVREDQSIELAASMLERSRLTEIPVVDLQGRIQGLFSADDVPSDQARTSSWSRRVSHVMLKDFRTVSEEESFGSLMEFFMADGQSNRLVVVVRHDKPLGVIYRSGLAALSEPLTVTSFAPDKPYSASSDYLVIPNTRSPA
jgi:predicted transcriptional regulator